MKQCPECEVKLQADALFCPECSAGGRGKTADDLFDLSEIGIITNKPEHSSSDGAQGTGRF